LPQLLPEVSMRRLPIAALLVAFALVAGACSSSTGPSWTYAPPTPAPTPGPSGSAAPSGAPSTAPSAGASGEPSAAPSGGGGDAVVITALNLQFTTPEVSAPASVPFVIDFRNEDAGQPHNVEIKDGGGVQKFMGQIVTGVTEAKYDVPALDPGTYSFVCTVHVNMKGTLKVGA
jgi:plastocyanin